MTLNCSSVVQYLAPAASSAVSSPATCSVQAAVDVDARDLDLGGGLGEREAVGLEGADGLAEGVALLDVVERDLQRALGAGHRGDRDRQALLRQVAHQQLQPAADLADHVLGRHRDVVEEQLGGVLALAADLLELAPAREALGVGGHGEQRHPVAPVRAATITRSAWMPLETNVLEPLSRQTSPSHLASEAIARRSEPVPGSVIAITGTVSPVVTARQPARALLVVGQLGQVRRDDVVDQREVVRDRAGVGALLVDDRVEAEVLDPEPAVLLGRREGDEALLGRLAPEAAVDHARGLPLLGLGHGLLAQEAADRLAEVLVLGLEDRPTHAGSASPSRGRRRSTWSRGRAPCRRPRARAAAS